MKEIMVLSELDQIKCISQPYRIKILEMFNNEKATAKMISERMAEPHAKINYHIKEMSKHGILELVEEVTKMSLVEKYYCPVARHYIVDSKSMKFGDQAVKASLNQYRISLFENLTETFYDFIDRDQTTGLKINLVGDLCLTDSQLDAFNRELQQLIAKYQQTQKPTGTARTYTYGGLIIDNTAVKNDK